MLCCREGSCDSEQSHDEQMEDADSPSSTPQRMLGMLSLHTQREHLHGALWRALAGATQAAWLMRQDISTHLDTLAGQMGACSRHLPLSVPHSTAQRSGATGHPQGGCWLWTVRPPTQELT